MMYRRILHISIFFLSSLFLSAQITIGVSTKPEEGALLQLKLFETSATGGATTDKDGGGLLMPRIKLEQKNDFWFIDAANQDYISKAARHTGLLVYNLEKTTDGMVVVYGKTFVSRKLFGKVTLFMIIAQTVVTPSSIRQFRAGDKVRMIIRRPET